ncbi:MAG: SusD/RagB family nutrient-binding outer membrane lipoprotein, partial [Sphingobacteriales bacterium]
ILKGMGFILMIAAVASCTKNFDTINTPPFNSPVANVQQLFTGFESNLQLGDPQVSYNSWTYPITQQGIVYTKADYVYGTDGGENWNSFYNNLSNYKALMGVIAASKDPAIYTNITAMAKVLKAYQAIKLSNLYGAIPYSEAGKALDYSPNNKGVLTPKYDSQQAVYLSCLTDLQWAVSHLSTTDATQYSMGSSDVLLQNNITQWIEFANSLRLRVALTMYDKDQAEATPQIVEALSKPLLDADNINVGLYPGSNVPNMDLQARQYSFGTECRLRMGTTMWQWMSSTNATDGSGIFDPRCSIFFEPNDAGEWNPFPQNPTPATPAEFGSPYNSTIRDKDWLNKDGDPPTTNLYANFNYFWARDITMPELFMTTAEVHFMKAEVYARGLGTAVNMGTAMNEYTAGVNASVSFWTAKAIYAAQNNPTISSFSSHPWATSQPSDAVMNAFLTNPVVAFDMTNAAHALKQIYGQEWIDMFRQPWEAWTLMKRTGQTPADPNNAAGYTTTYGSYNRYQYPASEQTYNYANWQAATGGNDLISTKIWITK